MNNSFLSILKKANHLQWIFLHNEAGGVEWGWGGGGKGQQGGEPQTTRDNSTYPLNVNTAGPRVCKNSRRPITVHHGQQPFMQINSRSWREAKKSLALQKSTKWHQSATIERGFFVLYIQIWNSAAFSVNSGTYSLLYSSLNTIIPQDYRVQSTMD